MAELLLEIFSEEIPARMQVRAGNDLSKLITDGLTKAGLTVEDAQVLTGPRRLTFVADLPLASPDVSEERKGPRVGAPEQALAGFMKAAGLSDISEAQIKSDKKGDFYVAITESKGRKTADILAELIPEVMGNFPWPKSMKSGASSFRWVRPLQGIICLLDGDVVEFQVGGVTSGNQTEGHRRQGKGPYKIKNFADYQKTLEGKGHVILSHDTRKASIIEAARKACADKGLELIEDEGLLNEVAGLAEWPVVILGDMDPAFLQLPDEVIRLSMRTHQKYFAVRDPKTSELAPNFIVVANQAAPDGGIEIAKGNAKVLSARLSDAVFFQQEDRKKKLEDYYEKLDTVVFHKKLGSIKDKAERVVALARELAPKVGADPDKAEQAARLAKCDLVTQTVIEFTSLQGQIGRLMFETEGGDKDIAIAIEDHYKPQGPSDAVPTDPVAIAVALADKLDTLVGFWAIDEKPTGSKDPFALRRAALGIVRIILENELRIDINDVIIQALNQVLKNQGETAHCYPEGLTDQEGILVKEFMEACLHGPGAFFANVNGMYDKLGNLIESDKYLIEYYPVEGEDNIYQVVEALLSDLKRVERHSDLLNQLDDLSPDGSVAIGEGENKRNIFPNEGQNFREQILSDLEEFNPMLSKFSADSVNFIADRLKVYLRDKGIRHDLIDAVFALGEDDLVAIVNRVEALQAFLSTEDGENLLAGYKRASNILKSAEFDAGEADEGTQAEESALFKALTAARPKIDKALEKEDYAGAMTAFSALRGPIDDFLDNVMVNSDKAAERQNRLRLLAAIRDTAQTIANFDAIQG